MSKPGLEQRLVGARLQDASDPLSSLRHAFAVPRAAEGRPLIYLCGHSLGLAPIGARATVEGEIERWETLAVQGHEHGQPAWIGYAESLQRPLATLAGALPHEVVAMNSLSINLHLMLASFYRPDSQRRSIIIEAGAFSSDRHAVASQIAWHGGNPATDLIELVPRAGQDLLDIEEVETCIAKQGSHLALVLWPGVQYRTGQLFDSARIARAAHAVGAIAGFDLAHSIGNVPLSLHQDDADFAVWCSYKYLNAGPGAVGGAFVHERHLTRSNLSPLTGWWGHHPATRFDMSPDFLPADGAASWAISNPPIFSSAPLRASLPLFEQAGMTALREKSIRLTAYLESLLQELALDHLQIVTGAEPRQRGCQLSVRLRHGGREMIEALARRDIIADWREPDIIRLAPVPLYNSFEDVLRCAWNLGEILASAR